MELIAPSLETQPNNSTSPDCTRILVRKTKDEGPIKEDMRRKMRFKKKIRMSQPIISTAVC